MISGGHKGLRNPIETLAITRDIFSKYFLRSFDSKLLTLIQIVKFCSDSYFSGN